MWRFQDDEAIRRCVPTGLRILSVSLLDWDQREFRDAEQERLRCVQQTGHDMMDDRLRGMSPANAIIPRISGWGGASLPSPEGPRVSQQDSIHSARQNVGSGPQVSRAQEQAYQALRVQEQAVQVPRVQEQGRLKPAMTVQEQLAQAERVHELTEPTL